jgi:formiminotetrahydrofolate cyclodeaminase
VPDSHAERFRDLTLDAFVDRLASAEPVPGGGSASAIVASLGASLVAMVASLSEGRPKYAEHAALHERARREGHRLADRFLQLADADAAAYGAFAAALKLPRDTDAERDARQAAIRSAARQAAAVPLDCVRACVELAIAAEALAGRSNANASSDLAVASRLAEAAANGAAQNVLVNLPSVGDDAWAEGARLEVSRLVDRTAEFATATRAVVEGREPRPPLDEPVPPAAERD